MVVGERKAALSAPQSPRILLIRRRYLGDLVLLGSIIRNLRQHTPNAFIAVMTEAAYADLMVMNQDVDAVLTFPRSAGDWWRLLKQLVSFRFKSVFDFDNRDKTALISLLSRAPQRFVLHHGRRVHLGWMYTDHELVTDSLSKKHLLDLHERLLKRAGVPVGIRDISLTPLGVDLDLVEPLSTFRDVPAGLPRLLVHPGSRSAYRVWPPEFFAEVLDQVQTSNQASITLIAGPTEQQIVDEIQRRAKTPMRCLTTALSIPQFGALLSKFDLLLCHDSGPMHLAAAVGTRVVALYGSQDKTVFAPIGEDHICLSPPLPCTNCVAPDQCQISDSYHNYCVRNIRPTDVLHAVQRQLNKLAH